MASKPVLTAVLKLELQSPRLGLQGSARVVIVGVVIVPHTVEARADQPGIG